MGITGLITFLGVGAVAGWLAGAIMDIRSFGLMGNVVFGALGAIAANIFLGMVGITMDSLLLSFVGATAGAAAILFVVKLIK